MSKHTLITIMAVCLLAAVPGHCAPSTTEQQALQQADQAFDKHDYERAILGYRVYLTAYPKSAAADRAHYRLARAFIERWRPEDAVRELDALRQDFPQSPVLPEALVLLYRTLLGLKSDRVEEIQTEILTRWPKSDAAWQTVADWFAYCAPRNTDWTLQKLEELVRITTDQLPPDAPARARTMRLAYLERARPAQYLSEAVTLVLSAREVPAPEGFADSAGLARRIYAPLIEAGRVDEAATLQSQVQAVLTRLKCPPEWTAQDLAAYRAALGRGAATVIAARTAVDARQYTFAADLARKLYLPLLASGRGVDAEDMHACVQAVLLRLNNPSGWAQTDAGAYYDALAAALTPEQRLARATAIANTPPGVPGADFLPTTAEAASLYAPLMTDGRLEEANAMHAKVQAILDKDSATRPRETTDTAAYVKALNALLAVQVTSTTASPEFKARIRQLCLDSWRMHPQVVIDTVIPLVRDRLLRDPAAADWVPPFAGLVMQLPPAHPSRATACLLLGQLAQSAAITLQATPGADPAPLLAQAEEAFLLLTRDYPALEMTNTARAALFNLYRDSGRFRDIDALAQKIADGPLLVEPLQWLAAYYLRLGTADGYQRGAACLTRLLKSAPQHAQCPVWQYQLARCWEGQGKSTEAVAAYKAVIDNYPASSCCLAAMWKLEQLK